ncbi:unnamed protein product [Didymodactylos carnosus]|uniref:Translocation protein SEC62 n=1 Tax=Didymodactylos carnosus TaxID=1234261 RepID=A0A813PDY8_9BILA|nr:unnamed protein product [Didymodactylos carnosus]CAF0815760.1 unnamed protein product [Didymodactylos carnosus]CAF3533631.1 unnamed protein product [Didymodactylos carnosus]CAF3599867.1 unnamed protein product [Didymodactylos carnosus]
MTEAINMSDNRKKSKRRKSEDDQLTKIEKAIAKHLRFKCQTKKGMLMGMQVTYFTGNKAVECLTESKWSSMSTKALNSSGDNNNTICFTSKHDCVLMLRKFLDNDMFRRAVKIYKEPPVQKNNKGESQQQEEGGDGSVSNTPTTTRQRKNKKDTQKSVAEPTTTVTSSTTKEKDDKDKDSKNKNKKKFKFELHDDQVFVDSPNECYVWIYDPTTIKQYIMGFLLVVGCIGVCLFPLWPTEVRTGVYYLSMVLAGLLGFLLSLAVIKYIIFAIVWVCTFGKIKFWLLPNLTEDVGVLESFVPLYNLEVGSTIKKTKDDKKKKESENDDKQQQEQTASQEEIVPSLTTTNPDEKETSADEDEQDENDMEKNRKSSLEDENKENTSRSSSLTSEDEKSQNKLITPHQQQKSSDEDFEVLSRDDIINETK